MSALPDWGSLIREQPGFYRQGSRISNSGRLNPKNDFLFKKLFGEEQGRPMLISLLNAILRRDGKPQITEVEIIGNTQLPVEMIYDKESSLDVFCKTDAKELTNVEMQVRRFDRMDYRSLFYMSKIFSSSIGAAGQYENLKRTIAINILDHTYLPLDKYHSVFHLYEQEFPHYRLTDVLEMHFVECPKFRKLDFNIHDPLHRWLRFLDQHTPANQLKELMEMDEAIYLAENRLAYLAMDDETRWLYEAREKALRDRASWESQMQRERERAIQQALLEGQQRGMAQGIEQGIERGIERGIEQGIERGIEQGIERGIEQGFELVAQNLLAEGAEPSFVSKVTGLSLQQIEKLQS